MPTNAVVANTPHYVLREGNRPIGPQVVRLHSGVECLPIYGFSDKGPYDQFCANSQLALRPYPLVKGYLRNQVAAPHDHLKVVVIDAAGPHEPELHAATMEAVLEAQQKATTEVAIAYRLSFDQEVGGYRVEEVSL